MPFILSGVCSPSEANYCSNPFEVFVVVVDCVLDTLILCINVKKIVKRKWKPDAFVGFIRQYITYFQDTNKSISPKGLEFIFHFFKITPERDSCVVFLVTFFYINTCWHHLCNDHSLSLTLI